jgi:hypothetical protein
MKSFIFWGSAFVAVAASIGACNSTVTDDSGSGGSASGGRASGGGKASGGRTGTGGDTATGGRRASGGGSSGGAAGAATSGGSDGSGGEACDLGMGGQMGGFGGMGGGDGSPFSESCAAACAVTTTIGCEGNEDPAACEAGCVAGGVEACACEYIALKNCEGGDVADGFSCLGPYGGVYYVAQSGDSACVEEFDAFFNCATQ